jgi:NTE family protein
MYVRNLIAIFALISACAPLSTESRRTEPPSARPIIPVKSERPLIGLVLGGGGARGFAHVGVIKALEEAGVVPDIVVGSSAGAVVAALYAGGYSGLELERMAVNLDQSALVDFALFGKGWVRGEALRAFINRALGNKAIQQLAKPFAAVATHAGTGEMVVFNHGETGLAVRASSTVPDLFIPPIIEGVEYLDGGLTSPVPVRVARAMGADFVIAVDITRYTHGRELVQVEADLRHADAVIRPVTIRTSLLDFTAKLQNMAAGEAAAREAAARITSRMMETARRKATRRGQASPAG